MKNKKPIQPKRNHLSVVNQLVNYIPPYLVPQIARQTDVEKQWRSFSPWSHTVSMIYAQVAHCKGLNEICDGLQLQSGALVAIRGATPPSANNLSNANRYRSDKFIEKLFWKVYDHIHQYFPHFGDSRLNGRFLRRFKAQIHLLDSSTIELVANCIPWAKHRRRKAAAKIHLKLGGKSFLPEMIVIDTAAEHDSKRARELCAHILEGEIVVFDKAYVDFQHLGDLDRRKVYWVTRAKDNMAYSVARNLTTRAESKIIKDQIIRLINPKQGSPELMRRIVAKVEVDGKEREMTFLTNHLDWEPWTVAELYRVRWDIEVFFKQIKQNLQLSDFYGQSANAVRWQIWSAMLAYLLIRLMAFLSQWGQSFSRLIQLLRAALWLKIDLLDLLKNYGIAGVNLKPPDQILQAYLPGF